MEDLVCGVTEFSAFDGECVDHRGQTCLDRRRKAYHRIAPHCDARVLHSPGTCEHCDKSSDRQAVREAARVCFTNDNPWSAKKSGWFLCPSISARGAKSVNSWSGNLPSTYTDKDYTNWAEKVSKPERPRHNGPVLLTDITREVWLLYEWEDVTTFGDQDRKMIRGYLRTEPPGSYPPCMESPGEGTMAVVRVGRDYSAGVSVVRINGQIVDTLADPVRARSLANRLAGALGTTAVVQTAEAP